VKLRFGGGLERLVFAKSEQQKREKLFGFSL
jgi:hypothetical protein